MTTLQVGTKVRILAQRKETHYRTKTGWKIRTEIIPERIGVIEDVTEPYSVYFPDTDSYELIPPTMLEPYGGD